MANVVTAVNKCLEKTKVDNHNCPASSHKKNLLPEKILQLEISFSKKPHAVLLHYRQVNHAERYNSIEMKTDGTDKYIATIPAAYTDSVYPLAYYFEVKETPKIASIYPRLG